MDSLSLNYQKFSIFHSKRQHNIVLMDILACWPLLSRYEEIASLESLRNLEIEESVRFSAY